MDTGQYDTAIQATNRLLDLFPSEPQNAIDEEYFAILVEVAAQRACRLREANAAQETALESTNVDVDRFTKRVGELLGRITSRIASNPKLWAIYSRYHELQNNTEKHINCLQRQCRAIQSAGWERDESRIQELGNAIARLAEVRFILDKRQNSFLSFKIFFF